MTLIVFAVVSMAGIGSAGKAWGVGQGGTSGTRAQSGASGTQAQGRASGTQTQATLQDFGYQAMKVNDHLASGSRPLLVLIASFTHRGWSPLAHSAAYFDSLIFVSSAPRSVDGYLAEVSLNRFTWSRTNYGVVAPVFFTAEEGDSNHMDDPKGISYVFREIVSRRGLNLSPFDTNGDGIITNDEMGVLIIHNQGDGFGGATRAIDPSNPPCLQLPNSSIHVCGIATTAGHETSFTTFCHELTHQLGALDLYSGNCKNFDLSLMSCTLESTPDVSTTWHLDPWHKMQLGWVEPRIRSLWLGGIETLPAAQLQSSNGPVVLYDPQRGAGEFFMLEYRTQTSPVGPGYDANAAGSGLVIWHVLQDANHQPTLIDSVTYAVNAEGAPSLDLGGHTPWGSNSTTPLLRWLDGTLSKTHALVHPFSLGDWAITVEWLTDDEAWADFNYTGWIELGTFDFPYKTLSGALAGTPRGGRLHIKASTTTETATSDKPMRIDTYGGSARMGQ